MEVLRELEDKPAYDPMSLDKPDAIKPVGTDKQWMTAYGLASAAGTLMAAAPAATAGVWGAVKAGRNVYSRVSSLKTLAQTASDAASVKALKPAGAKTFTPTQTSPGVFSKPPESATSKFISGALQKVDKSLGLGGKLYSVL